VDVLETLSARLPLAVLTNKPQAHTDRLLDGLGLSRFFRDVIGGDTAFGRKPAPSGLEELARRARVPVTATTLIGDSPIDLETARRAGSQAVLVRYGFGFREGELRSGERAVGSPADLAAVILSTDSHPRLHH
jgi:phosphoglycolate phosphatase